MNFFSELRGGTMTQLRLALLATLLFGTFSVSWVKVSGANKQSAQLANPRTPILIELFTSEGCSSCPPADALLEKLDESQPVPAAELIVLSEHVDYWNDSGWKDPYSSSAFSDRQRDYGERFGLGTVYTPQMVVDGHLEFVGSDERRAIQAIESATKVQKISVVLSSIRRQANNTIALHVEAGPWPPDTTDSGTVLIAIADDSDESYVNRGENAGHTLKHVAVLRSLIPVGTVSGSHKFSRDVTVNANKQISRDLRIVAFVQETTGGGVWGAGAARLANQTRLFLTSDVGLLSHQSGTQSDLELR